MEAKILTGNYYWTKNWFGGFSLWVEIKNSNWGFDSKWERKYVKGNISDMNELGIPMSLKK